MSANPTSALGSKVELSHNNRSAVDVKELLARLISFLHLFKILVKSFCVRIVDFISRAFHVAPFPAAENAFLQLFYQQCNRVGVSQTNMKMFPVFESSRDIISGLPKITIVSYPNSSARRKE